MHYSYTTPMPLFLHIILFFLSEKIPGLGFLKNFLKEGSLWSYLLYLELVFWLVLFVRP